MPTFLLIPHLSLFSILPFKGKILKRVMFTCFSWVYSSLDANDLLFPREGLFLSCLFSFNIWQHLAQWTVSSFRERSCRGFADPAFFRFSSRFLIAPASDLRASLPPPTPPKCWWSSDSVPANSTFSNSAHCPLETPCAHRLQPHPLCWRLRMSWAPEPTFCLTPTSCSVSPQNPVAFHQSFSQR